MQKKNFFFGLLCPVFLTGCLYIFVYYFIGQGYEYELFFKRSWIQPVNTLVFFTILGYLTMKYMAMGKEKKAIEKAEDFFLNRDTRTEPDEYSDWIHQPTLSINQHTDFLGNFQIAMDGCEKSDVFHTITGAIDRMRKTNSTSSLNDYLKTRSEHKFQKLESSYSTIRFLVWLGPTLGFLGTVWGIGAALYRFGLILMEATDFKQIKQFLPDVTSSLGTAFDTTLLALVYSIIATFLLSFLYKLEENLIERIDSLGIDYIFPLFKDGDELIKAIKKLQTNVCDVVSNNFNSLMQFIKNEIKLELPDMEPLKVIVEQCQGIVLVSQDWLDSIDKLSGSIQNLQSMFSQAKVLDIPEIIQTNNGLLVQIHNVIPKLMEMVESMNEQTDGLIRVATNAEEASQNLASSAQNLSNSEKKVAELVGIINNFYNLLNEIAKRLNNISEMATATNQIAGFVKEVPQITTFINAIVSGLKTVKGV